jgi:hypothetical protein
LTEYCVKGIFFMTWNVVLCDEFEPEFERLAAAVQDELLAHMQVLERFGPSLGRPHVDTLKGSRHSNMKELRLGPMAACGALPLRSIRGEPR